MNKFISLLALMLVVGAFLLPTSALANVAVPDDDGEYTLQPQSTPEPQPTPTPEPPPVDETPSSNPWANSPWTPPADGRPFTPDGQATVTDNATSDDAKPSGASKEFFTFTTPEGNVFFLVVDRNRPTDNVYFLNAVTEADLMALAERSEEPDDDIFAPPPLLPAPTPPDDADGDGEDDETAPPIESEPTSNNGTMVFIVIAVLAFGGAAYYLKIVRPKKQGAAFDDEDEEYEDEEDYNADDYEDEEEVLVDDEPEEVTVDSILAEYGKRKDREFPDDEERLYDEIH